MKIKIDEFGRLLIPKAFRNELGIIPGSQVEIVAANDELKIRVVSDETVLKRVGTILVHQGTTEDDIVNSIKAHRNNRIKSIWN